MHESPATNIRVGEAFTKDKKSSARWREGLTDMARTSRPEVVEGIKGDVGIKQELVGVKFRGEARKRWRQNSIGQA